MISVDRIQRALRALPEIGTHEIAEGLAMLAQVLMRRRMEDEAQVIHESATKMRELARARAAERRRTG